MAKSKTTALTTAPQVALSVDPGSYHDQVAALANGGGRIVIKDDKAELVVADLWKAGRDIAATIEADFMGTVAKPGPQRAMNMALKAIREQKKGYLEMVEQGVRMTQEALTAWKRQKEEAARELARKANEAAERERLAKIADAEKALARKRKAESVEAAKAELEDLKAAPPPDEVLPPVVQTAVPTREYWSAEVVDMAELLAAVVGCSAVLFDRAKRYAALPVVSRPVVPTGVLMANLSGPGGLNRMAEAAKREDFGIPGVVGVRKDGLVKR